MMIVLLIAGIGCLLVGLLAIIFGIPVKEFSFGNTLILVGVIATCTGMVLLGLGLIVRELRTIARRLGAGASVESRARSRVPVGGGLVDSGGGFPFNREEVAAQYSDRGEPAPWQEETGSRDRVRVDGPPAAGPAEPPPEPPVKPRRNLLFSSTSRKERERAAARAAEPPAPNVAPAPPVAPSAVQAAEVPPATFDDAWPKSERARGGEVPPQRRGGSQAPSTLADASEPVQRNEAQPEVTVLKSGVVDGMAYSLYSDGSIEAQMPEGMMRFASIDELRSHLDQRP